VERQRVYGTIRRILSNGKDGALWIAEIMPPTNNGTLFLETDRAPSASVGDDVMTTAEVTTERNGRVVARNPRIGPTMTAAYKRLRDGIRGSNIDANWKTLSKVAVAESHSDVRTVLDGQIISIIRPTATNQPAADVLKRHTNQNMVGYDAPRFVLDPVVYRNHSAYLLRQAAALPAGIRDKITVNGPEITPSIGQKGETRAWLMNFGNVENCSYTLLSQLSGPGLVPKFDIPATLAHEFTTVHEFAHSMDDQARKVSEATPEKRRRMESFADAFAITELALAGRNLNDLSKIVACREAAIIGASFRRDGKRARIALMEHLSGDAARAALNEAAKILKRGGKVTPAEVVRQAHKLSVKHSISNAGIQELDKSLRKLKQNATTEEIKECLDLLAKSTKDPALARMAKRLATTSDNFFSPADQRRKDVISKIAVLHQESLKKHVEYSAENGMLGRTKELLMASEKDWWSVRERNLLRRSLRAILPNGKNIGHAVSSNIEQQVAARDASASEIPAIQKLPETQSASPNPWTYSLADRLKQSAAIAEQAYAVITEVAALGTVAPVHQERFSNAMRSLSLFAEAVTWRDVSKDGKAVRKKLEETPELEDHFRMVRDYSYEDIKLPVSEGKRLQLQSIILAVNPRAELPEMPQPAEPATGFGSDLFMGTDRD
jgi:hypothetical protein